MQLHAARIGIALHHVRRPQAATKRERDSGTRDGGGGIHMQGHSCWRRGEMLEAAGGGAAPIVVGNGGGGDGVGSGDGAGHGRGRAQASR